MAITPKTDKNTAPQVAAQARLQSGRGRFAGKTAVITGAAQGIGRAVALAMAAEGAHAVLLDRSEIVLDVRDELLAAGHRATALLADVEKYPDCQRAMAEAQALDGRIDVLVNNVGGTIWVQPFAYYSEAQITAEINRSLFPTMWCCHAVLPHMLAQGGGSIVNVSSTATRGIYRVPYSAAKGGVNAITVCLAFEYAQQGIRVNGVAPGGTDVGPRRIPRNSATMTEQEQTWYQAIVDQSLDSSFMRRYGNPDEQAAAILFLASDEASYITGVTLPVAGGDLG
ncbi:1,6-dihydroxycyclohexa-2,4-diene-1-carboxylate dehydrogenase [Burkholderia multivorans]|uniref:1,6-dihydroxycyclohexa-2,4-diene-1-carboxylate dehydrogenase n=1 Tax=Burkholderia multivorans TaxID=87883 RepID=UPI000CFF2214|nr:1,6-dihydroxycyclohexa-2,4-diene-1-carboxylate dehydrogenase [Burkholderia multivorans]PRF64456.1 1,6-dihydroxycyclohexa-2,4-diene-1-carboxylate dehydrogenase [Burkholderia multivorans]